MNKIYVKSALVTLLMGISIVSYSQIISTIAGNGVFGFSGDGGPATDAEFGGTYGVKVDPIGNIYVADDWNCCIRIINTSTKREELNIYPVPNTGVFTISDLTQGQIIELYNYTGQKLSRNISDKNNVHFDISNYANGIYLIRILNNDGSVFATKKIVKTE